MSVISFIERRLADFVLKQAPTDLLERTRLQTFVAVRLGFAGMILLITPIWLLVEAPPPLWQCLAYCFLIAPMASVALLSRGVALDVAQGLSVFGLLGFASTLGFFSPVYLAIAFSILLMAVLEASATGNFRLVVITAAGAIIAASTIAVHSGYAAQPPVSYVMMAIVAAGMVVYAGGLAWGAAYTNAVISFGERRETLRHEALAQTIGDLVLRQDRDGSVTFASKEAFNLFGLAPRELMGRGLFERIHVGDRPAFLSTVADAATAHETVSCMVRLRRGAAQGKDEHACEPVFAWIEMRSHSLPQERRASDRQDQAAIVTIVRDMTRAKQAEQEILDARASAEQANIWKDRFLANVSHELRTPLNAIIGFAEILSNDEIAPSDPARQREYAQIIHSSGHHLLDVVTSILDVSKIDAGSFEIVTEPFALPPLLDQCCDMIRLKAGQAGVQILREYGADLEELVADKRACKQIIINLLSNAIKFTPAGGLVTLTARPEGNVFVISVSDTGIGIAPDDLRHIGDPFFQVHNSTTRAYEGTGLGLSLVRGLVGLHAGSISIESALDLGTTVTICLPSACAETLGRSRLAPIEAFTRHGVAAKPLFQTTMTNSVKKIA